MAKAALSTLLLLVLLALAPFEGQSVHLRSSKVSAGRLQAGLKLHSKEEPEAAEAPAEGEEAPAEGEAAEGEEPAAEEHEEPEEEGLEDIPAGTCQAVDFQAPELEELEECLCQEGEFWNWRSRKCSKQGAKGYECGFFPKELQTVACAPGLTCKATPNTDAEHYVSHGRFRGQDLGLHPAVCEKCGADDECSKEPECVKKVSFDKDDWVCVTVRFAKLVPDVPEEHHEEEHDEEAAAPAEGEEAAAEGEEAPAEGEDVATEEASEEGANATALIMTGRKHTRRTRSSKHGRKVAKEQPEGHEEEHQEPPMKIAYSWGHTCVTVYKAKQWLGTNRIRHIDLKAAEEILEHAEKKLEAQACKIAEAADVSEHPPGSEEEEEEHHEEEAAPAEGEAAAAEGEEAPAEEAPAEE